MLPQFLYWQATTKRAEQNDILSFDIFIFGDIPLLVHLSFFCCWHFSLIYISLFLWYLFFSKYHLIFLRQRKQKHRYYYLHRSRVLVSPVCRICRYKNVNKAFFLIYFISSERRIWPLVNWLYWDCLLEWIIILNFFWSL